MNNAVSLLRQEIIGNEPSSQVQMFVSGCSLVVGTIHCGILSLAYRSSTTNPDSRSATRKLPALPFDIELLRPSAETPLGGLHAVGLDMIIR